MNQDSNNCSIENRKKLNPEEVKNNLREKISNFETKGELNFEQSMELAELRSQLARVERGEEVDPVFQYEDCPSCSG